MINWWQRDIDRIYKEMNVLRSTSDFERETARRLRLTLFGLITWLIFLGVISVWLYAKTTPSLADARATPSQARFALKDPLLKGPPQFILLTMIIGLSAYLRQVRAAAVELRDKIAAGSVWNYPLQPPYLVFTRRKIRLLDEVSSTLTTISPFFILLFVAIATRAGFDAVDRLSELGGASTRVLYVVDLLIVGWVFLGVVGLAYSHFVSRVQDDKIRVVARSFEEEIIRKTKSHQIEKQVEAPTQRQAANGRTKTATETTVREVQTVFRPRRRFRGHKQIAVAILSVGLFLLLLDGSSERKRDIQGG